MNKNKKKIIVWGTGAILRRYYRSLDEFEVLYYIDKDANKWGIKLNGIEVRPPEALEHHLCSYIILMTDYYPEILEELEYSRIPKEKLVPYIHIGKISMFPVKTKGKSVALSKWAETHEKIVLLISHEFSRTGAPIALLNLALELKKMGYSILMAGMCNGSLSNELESNEIDYINDISLYYKNERYLKIIFRFEFVVVNTITLNEVALEIAKSEILVLWWIHESSEEYYTHLDITGNKNLFIYGVGRRVIDCFHKFYPYIKIGELLYSIPDFYSETMVRDTKDRIDVAIIGLVQPRKGLDILIDAFNQLETEELSRFRLWIVGKAEGEGREYCLENEKKIPGGLEYDRLGELNLEQIKNIYRKLDLLVMPSREDPMPMAVTEAMMNCVTCMVSDQVGQKEYIRQGENGFVFHNTDELSELLSGLENNRNILAWIGRSARKIYEENFMPSSMHKRLEEIILEMNHGEKRNCD